MGKKRNSIFDAAGGRMLRPHSVGSSVHWYIHVDEFTYQHGDRKGKKGVTFNGHIRLTDCENHIDWGLSYQEDLTKLDNAIAELKSARAALLRAQAVYRKFREATEIKDEEEDDGF